jgi:hypothetical protein
MPKKLPKNVALFKMRPEHIPLPPCQCSAAGQCELFQRAMGPRMVAICRGAVLSDKKCAAYRQLWARRAARKSQKP